MTKPIIAIMPGDCTGIGPEQTARILAERRGCDVARLVYVGDKRVLEMGMRQAKVRGRVSARRIDALLPEETR